MIKSFADKRTEQIFNGEKVKRLDARLQNKVLRRLRYIDAAERIEDLLVPPSNKLEKKEGDLKEFYAIWVNTQWRVIFKWIDNEAHEVQLVDYH
ncbi:MAG: type II toxin-antitoxin system RelE/ParE family toxin [Candidatus Scalindua sp. AMX11]|nr:MAG: type II toxin-antitoxin system RelE/ParE family toxin [Candidatus Scalindua sp.]NOG85399.1 type II toxin-antitoxin system RelE/ParE family toxin [Planctomycetota bacterium]RZV83995.1 MAG: type II toxin-antitoxin system RelE/ParE family toxin [Candidatus Scalindua sp. SCAELEC01]TDE65720.1 MAG: type II toxin-antitoxin system RelE/ParE family toxin [Candidatus Scalindua sp. AMX11]GJQ58787.1 MAG: plasmid maintenance system killer protein [Candidatus Scalindua sp.]